MSEIPLPVPLQPSDAPAELRARVKDCGTVELAWADMSRN
jgi:hypothetical protein